MGLYLVTHSRQNQALGQIDTFYFFHSAIIITMRAFFSLATVTCSLAMSTREAIQMDMEKFNNDAMCWGVENMMYYRLAQYQAMEECSKSGLASRMVRPTNPFTTLPANLNNQQGPLNRFFNNANSRNPLSALLSRNSIGSSAQNSWCRPRQPPRRRGLSTTSSSTMNFRYLY